MTNRNLAIGGIALLVIAGALSLLLSNAAKREQPANNGGVVRVNKPNEPLQNAANKAQQKLSEFEDRLASAKPGEQFAILGKFETSAGPEYLWLRDPVYTEGSFDAVLDQQPMALDAKKGDRLTVTSANVFDWLIKSGGKTEGGFTQKVLQHR